MKSSALLCWVGNGRQLSECVVSFIVRERERERLLHQSPEKDFSLQHEAQVVRFFYLRTRTPDFGGQAFQGPAVNPTWIRLDKDKGPYLSQCVHVVIPSES